MQIDIRDRRTKVLALGAVVLIAVGAWLLAFFADDGDGRLKCTTEMHVDAETGVLVSMPSCWP